MQLLPIAVLLFITDSCYAFISPRALADRAHQSAVRHTSRFAKDLRIALRSVLVEDTPKIGKRAVYCTISDKTILGGSQANTGSGSTPTNRTVSASAASTSTRSSSTATISSSPPTSSATPSQVAASPWNLIEQHSGSEFFDGWNFFTADDPTHGIVDYVDESTARANNLLSINDRGNAIMRVEQTPTVENLRQSVRITTATTFTGGLVILDAVHMPTGCGTWPAFWTNGPNWPTGGEIDIIEGVGDYTNVQATIHTDPGCTLGSKSSSELGMSGTLIGGQDCAVVSTGNQGCGVRATQTNSYGAAFNTNGGGVYAMKWDADSISVYFFARGSIPKDILEGRPVPSTWGLPIANWSASHCDPFRYFKTHSVIINTTLCGDWASGVWNGAGIPGQETSCAARTGYSTCEAFVRANGASFAEAYWEVKSVQIYQLR